MKIIIPGGSGQVGTILARNFLRGGHEVVVLSRRAAQQSWRVATWDGRSLGTWAQEFDGADVVINLAGRSVNCRYHPRHRREILDSRIESTRAVGAAIAACQRPPRVWLQASTATIYAHRFDADNDEVSGLMGGSEPGTPAVWRFSIDVARAWEDAADEVRLTSTRLVKLRLAMLMNADRGGTFDLLSRLVRYRLGGCAGDGRQYMSWIHEEDFLRAVDWLIEHQDVTGAVNVAAPFPVPNTQFMRSLRRAWGTRLGLPASRWLLEVGTWLMRSESELILKSRRVVPRRLLEAGFDFHFPTWTEAARDLCARWRSRAALTGPGL